MIWRRRRRSTPGHSSRGSISRGRPSSSAGWRGRDRLHHQALRALEQLAARSDESRLPPRPRRSGTASPRLDPLSARYADGVHAGARGRRRSAAGPGPCQPVSRDRPPGGSTPGPIRPYGSSRPPCARRNLTEVEPAAPAEPMLPRPRLPRCRGLPAPGFVGWSSLRWSGSFSSGWRCAA